MILVLKEKVLPFPNVIVCSLLDFRSGSFGNEVSRVLGGGLVPGLIQLACLY